MIWQFIMNVDLHCHTTASDGLLTPTELLRLAEQRGVTMLSITDHDTIKAYADIDFIDLPLRLIPGIEFSSWWRKIGVHIVGLNIDLQHPTMIAGMTLHTQMRRIRAEKILRTGRKSSFVVSLQKLEHQKIGALPIIYISKCTR